MAYIEVKLDPKAARQLEANFIYMATVLGTTRARRVFSSAMANALRPTRALARRITKKGSRPLGLSTFGKKKTKVKRTKRAFQIVQVRQIKKKLTGAYIGFIGSKDVGIRYPQLLGIEYGNAKFKPANRPLRSAIRLSIRSSSITAEINHAVNNILSKTRPKRIS